MKDTRLIDLFQRARPDRSLAVIEGVQALKHAARFQAVFKHIITCDINLLKSMLDELAPDVKALILTQSTEVSEVTFAKLSPQPHRTKVIAIAERTAYTLADLAADKPIILLEDPRDLENIGAVIRVSAAADAAGVLITGPVDIWHPGVIRGAAGLQFALPVLHTTTSAVLGLQRPIIALDPTGEISTPRSLMKNAVFVFGTERSGISTTMLERSDQIVRLPMKQGVSSLNLATSVAATLYRLQ